MAKKKVISETLPDEKTTIAVSSKKSIKAKTDDLEPKVVEVQPPVSSAAKNKKDEKAAAKALKAKKIAKKKAKKAAKKKQREANSDDEPKLRDLFKLIKKNVVKQKEPVSQKRVKRVKSDYQMGLSNEQVQERIIKGQTNAVPNTNVKTVWSIIRENVFTFFNILCFIVFAALVTVNVLYKQSWSNILFMAIILINIIIGIVQEIRAKKNY